MSSNKLMEAASDILSGSKRSAPAMPPEKLAGEVQDMGGPTPQNYKQDDDSAKLKSATTDKSAHNQSTIKTKPSAASGQVTDSLKKEQLQSDDEVIAEDAYKDDIEALTARVKLAGTMLIEKYNQVKEPA